MNGDSPKGLVLTLLAEVIISLWPAVVLTFLPSPCRSLSTGAKPDVRARVPLVFLIPRKIVCNREAVKAKIVSYGSIPQDRPIPAFSGIPSVSSREAVRRLEDFIRDHDPV